MNNSLTHPTLPWEAQLFVQKLKMLDFKPLALKLMQAEGWNRAQATTALIRYLMFLCLISLYPNAHLIPTQEIDFIWHQHLENEEQYAQDCQMLFGTYLYHSPHKGLSQGEKQNRAFEETKTLLAKHFDADSLGDLKGQLPAACEPVFKVPPKAV